VLRNFSPKKLWQQQQKKHSKQTLFFHKLDPLLSRTPSRLDAKDKLFSFFLKEKKVLTRRVKK
jgi:hypothetical protein